MDENAKLFGGGGAYGGCEMLKEPLPRRNRAFSNWNAYIWQSKRAFCGENFPFDALL